MPKLSNRKFYKTSITLHVISEYPYAPQYLGQIHQDITEGDCSGVYRITNTKVMNGASAAKALIAQGSSPAFFSLTEKGEDIS